MGRHERYDARQALPLRQRAPPAPMLRHGSGDDAVVGRGPPRGAAGRGSRAGVRQGRCRNRDPAVSGYSGSGAGPYRRPQAAEPDPQAHGARRRRGAGPTDRRPQPQRLLGDQRADLDAAQSRRLGRGRDPRPQCGADRPGERPIPSPDGHDHDRDQPAADRRIPLPPCPGAGRPARPDPAGQPRLEPEEPGQDGRGAGALRREHGRRAIRPADGAGLRPPGGGGSQFRKGGGTARQGRGAVARQSERAALEGRLARPHQGL